MEINRTAVVQYNAEQIRRTVSHSRPIESQARRELAGYYAMIENVDWNYGRIVQTLEDTGLLADTHIFSADHADGRRIPTKSRFGHHF